MNTITFLHDKQPVATNRDSTSLQSATVKTIVCFIAASLLPGAVLASESVFTDYTLPQKIEDAYHGTSSGEGPVTLDFLTFGTGSSEPNSKISSLITDAYDSKPSGVLILNKQIDLSSGSLSVGKDADAKQSQIVVADNGSAFGVLVVDVKSYAQGGFDMSKGLITNATSGSEIKNLMLTNLDASGFTKDSDGTFTFNLGTNIKVTDQDIKLETEFYDAAGSDNGTITVKVEEKTVQEYKKRGLYLIDQIENEVRNMRFSDNALTEAVIFGNSALKAFDAELDKKLNVLVEQYNKLVAPDSEKLTDADALMYVIEQEKFEGLSPQQMEIINQAIAIDNSAESYFFRSVNAASNMAVESGAFTTALDVQDQINKTIARRTSAANTNAVRGDMGVTAWVDVFGTTNEAKRLYGSNTGYEADIYGAVLGFDYTAACGGVLGLAINVGTADSNSVGSSVKVENDSDFYGLSLYAAKKFGDVNIQADLSYTQTSNDLSTKGAFGAFSESLDADIFTFGVGAEYLAKAGSVNVVPHAGIRLTTIDMEDSKFGAEYDKMTVYQLPFGIAFSGTFETNGWKLAPMADISVVPTFGDKDAVAKFIGNNVTTRVVDINPVQGTLGVAAQNGAWTFGLNYQLTAGGKDRLNNAFNVNARYSF